MTFRYHKENISLESTALRREINGGPERTRTFDLPIMSLSLEIIILKYTHLNNNMAHPGLCIFEFNIAVLSLLVHAQRTRYLMLRNDVSHAVTIIKQF